MKRLINWICSFGGDKYIHSDAGELISWLSALLLGLLVKNYLLCALVGFILGLCAGAGKEIYDKKHGEKFDIQDMIFTMYGALKGSIAFYITTLIL